MKLHSLACAVALLFNGAIAEQSFAQAGDVRGSAASSQPANPLDYYPKRAKLMHIEGEAWISCHVTAEGLLSDCKVLSETPPDAGFGDAALKMAHLFKMKPLVRDGQPVEGGTVKVPIRFRLPPATPSTRSPGQ